MSLSVSLSMCINTMSVSTLSCMYQHYNCIITISACVSTLHQHYHSINVITVSTLSWMYQHYQSLSIVTVSTLSLYHHYPVSMNTITVSTLSLYQHYHCVCQQEGPSTGLGGACPDVLLTPMAFATPQRPTATSVSPSASLSQAGRQLLCALWEGE